MKCLTLTQPWATLVALGEKRIETRSWFPRHLALGEPIAIHAAKTFPRAARELCYEAPFCTVLMRHQLTPAQLPLGAVVAIARFGGAVWTQNRYGPHPRLLHLAYQERAFGNYVAGRYAWFLDNVQPIVEPVPARGALGLWDWEQPVVITAATTGVFQPC